MLQEEWARSQLTVRVLHTKVELQPSSDVLSVIEAPNDSDVPTPIDRSTTEASSFL